MTQKTKRQLELEKIREQLELDKLTGVYGEFKKFIAKGNVIDMATGVIIGGAFGKIVSSLVNDLIMPSISLVLGNVNISELTFVCREATAEHGAVVLKYGNFLQTTIDFIIISASIFLMLKLLLAVKARTPPPPPPAAPKDEVVLLTEIRDLLRKNDQQEETKS